VLVWAPTSGHIGMSVSIFSYRGEVTIGLMADATLIPDPERIVTELDKELRVLGQLDREHLGKRASRRTGVRAKPGSRRSTRPRP
jgi:hypothetical protein